MRASVIALALALDRLGEPPTALHPTAWMGRWVNAGRARHRDRAGARMSSTSSRSSFIEGALLVGGGVLASAALARLAERLTDDESVMAAALLKPSLALNGLTDAARQVERALERGDLADARRLLSWHLVSRDTSALSAAEVAGAAIESVAENLGDSVVAPMLAYLAGGIGAAYAYRFVNTADAMLGYRTAELEWFGKTAARLDDVLGFIPSRVAALCIAAAASAGRGSLRAAIRVALHDAGRTASPNAGWPMAAMAGALGVRLSKRGAAGRFLYTFNRTAREPVARDIRRARRIVTRAAWIAAAAIAALELADA